MVQAKLRGALGKGVSWRVQTRSSRQAGSVKRAKWGGEGTAHATCFPFAPLYRLVSSVQAIMASTVGYIVSSSCKHIIDDQ